MPDPLESTLTLTDKTQKAIVAEAVMRLKAALAIVDSDLAQDFQLVCVYLADQLEALDDVEGK